MSAALSVLVMLHSQRFFFLRLRVLYQARGDHGCRCVSGSDADLLPTAACQLSLFTTAYIAMRVFLQSNSVALPSVVACAGLSLGLPPSRARHACVHVLRVKTAPMACHCAPLCNRPMCSRH